MTPPPAPGLLVRLTASVRVRVTVAATVVAFLGGVAGAFLFAQSLHSDLESALVESSRQQAQTISAQLEQGASPQEAAITARDDVITQILGPDGEILGSDHPRLKEPLRDTAGESRGLKVPLLDDSYVVVASPAPTGEMVVVAHSEEQVARARRTALVLLTVSLPVALAVLAGAVWLSVGRALRPVESMRQEADRITSAHAERRLRQPLGGDEISRLATTLNQMLDRIDASQRRQRQFVSDASHELRSPLAVIRQLAEVARRHPEEADVRALTGGVLAEEQRMEGLVKALLTLARLDDRDLERTQVVDLDDVVLDEVKRARVTGGPEIDARTVGAGQVRGDALLFTQVVRNLVSNAVRHASSAVRVSLHEDEDAVCLVVEDDGAGIPADQREHVFDRFVRLDDARARDAGGSGLGLAIVAKVVASAHGTVTVDEARGGGARFEVRLPPA